MIGPWLTLFTCGAFLSFVSLYYGNIACCIGTHMGWVLMIKGFEKVTDGNDDGKYAWLIGDYDKVTGYLAFAIIGIICLAYWFFFMRKSKKATESEQTA